MSPDIIRALVPYGLAGLALFTVAFVAVAPQSGNKRTITIVAMFILLLIYGIDKWLTQIPASSPIPSPINSASAGPPDWIDTGISADWGGRDVAFTNGEIPKYGVKGTPLCDEVHVSWVSICWNNRPTGYPDRSLPNDVIGNPGKWCTYKGPTIKISTPPDGGAVPNLVYLCAHRVPH
jgi:hypothetical protein